MMLALDDTFGNDNGATSGVVTYADNGNGGFKLVNIKTDDAGTRTSSDVTDTTNLINAVKNKLNDALDAAARNNDLQTGTANFDNVAKRVLDAWCVEWEYCYAGCECVIEI